MTNIIKNVLQYSTGAILACGCAHAQETTEAASDTPPLLAHYSFDTDDALGVVSTFDTVMEQCGDGIPASVSIFDELFNGANPQTHTVIFSFADAAGFMQMGQTFATCPAAVAFGHSISGLASSGSEFLGEPIMGGGDVAADNVFMVFQMKVSDEATYASAFGQLMESRQGSGSYGLVRALAGTDGGTTHYAFVGAADVDALLAAMREISPANSAARRSFNEAVSDIRKVQSSSMTLRVKTYE